MRKLDYEAPFSDEDVVWLRQAGSIMTEEQIAAHQARFETEVPEAPAEDDIATNSALDPSARLAEYEPGSGAPALVDPTQEDPAPDDVEGDDYDSWKVAELEAEVTNRNQLEDTTDVEVIGTGRNGSVTKADLIKGLRLWDGENPNALS